MLLTVHLIEGLILDVLDSWRQLISQQCRRCHDHFGVTVRVGVANGGIEFCIVLHQPVQAERRNVDIDPHKTKHDVLGVRPRGNCLLSKRFGNVQPSTASHGLGKLFDWLRSRHLSKTHHQ